jgi:hypothetical protein
MRNVVWSGSSIVVLAVCLFGSVATADDATSLMSNIEAAQSAVNSYKVDVTGPGDRTGSTVSVRGVGIEFRTKSGSFDAVSYLVGTTVYQRFNGGAWTKFIIDPEAAAAFAKSITRHRSTELLPDRIEDGVTVGAIKVDMTVTIPSSYPDSSPPTTRSSLSVCTYDKVTLLFRVCKTDTTTRQYSRYDDPSLTIEVPAEAKAAPAIDLPHR